MCRDEHSFIHSMFVEGCLLLSSDMLPSGTASGNTAFSLGEREFRQRRIERAVEAFFEAERRGHDPIACSAYRWQCWMLLGKFENAWMESDYIRVHAARAPDELWDGQPFAGRRVVVRCLHGFGDAIQFIRYAQLVRNSAAGLVVESHPEMVSVLKLVSGVDRVISWADSLRLSRGAWDQQIEVTELPGAFRTTIGSIPCQAPYVAPPRTAIEQSRQRLVAGGKPRVGLMWASGFWNPLRSMKLTELLPVLETEGIDFYSFQRGYEHAELAGVETRYGIRDTSRHSPDIADTAADLSNMDLLITVDTMVAHLAGAVGTPVWTMLPFHADWRWMTNRNDTPWYPTMRLFRQPAPGEWRPVVSRVARMLADSLKDPGRCACTRGTRTSAEAAAGAIGLAPAKV